jgi:hypothetical protein
VCVSSRILGVGHRRYSVPVHRRGQRVEEGLRDLDRIAERSWLPPRLPARQRHEPRVGLAVLGDDDLLARVHALEQAREVGLGLVDVDQGHTSL